jgi:hypothetical protein
VGGTSARTYSRGRVASLERPFAARKSSREPRRKLPAARNSKGMGEAGLRRLLTRVERA